jgi:hypothetical protein
MFENFNFIKGNREFIEAEARAIRYGRRYVREAFDEAVEAVDKNNGKKGIDFAHDN